MNHSMQRRRVLAWMGAATLSPLAPTALGADERPLTPRMTEGPFYPRSLPRDADADLTRVEGRAQRAAGTPLAVSGRVLDRSVELFCDNLRRYAAGEPLLNVVDPTAGY